MAIRIMVSMRAKPGKGRELAKARAPRAAEVRNEPGCEQFDLFQNTEDPDHLVLFERWTDQASLDVHAERNRERPTVAPELRDGPSISEHYTTES
jgi:quinol monooxygenase YgiN